MTAAYYALAQGGDGAARSAEAAAAVADPRKAADERQRASQYGFIGPPPCLFDD
jgi:hypothetical protein